MKWKVKNKYLLSLSRSYLARVHLFSGFSKEYILSFPLTGIREAAGDALQVCSYMKPAQLTKLDSELLKAGLPSIANLKSNSYKQFLKITSKGKISNDDEWRFIRSFVETDTLNHEQRDFAYGLMEDYEFGET